MARKKTKYPLARAAESIRKRGTEGKLTRKAKSAGKSIPEYCAESHDRSTTAECNLAKAFRRASKKRSKKASRRNERRRS